VIEAKRKEIQKKKRDEKVYSRTKGPAIELLGKDDPILI
jgi:hypothetical protein